VAPEIVGGRRYVRIVVEDELVKGAPGPALAAALERFDPATLTADEAVPVLKAWSRQRAHDHARMAATLARVAALSRHATGPTMGDWAGSEIAAALTWTEGRAAGELEFAEELVALPLVATAFDTGRIDYGKARVFTDVLGPAELPPRHVEVLCATYLLAAPGLTSGQLRHRLTRALLAIDPEAAARRYRRAVTTRQVVGYLSADGTAVISASGLPAEQAAAACARVDELAEQLRRARHPGTITQIRADLFLRLLDGSLTGRTTAEIIAVLLAEAARDAPDTPADASPPDTASNCAPEAASSGTESPEGVSSEAAEGTSTTPGAVAGAAPGAATGVEIRVGLATLLSLDQRPGEIPGWGPVLPQVARDLVARYHRTPWRFAVVDQEGHLLLAGTTRQRPTAPEHREPVERRAVEGGVVELHLTAELLTALAHDPAAHPEWAAVVADIAAQFADRARLRATLGARPQSRHARGPLLRHMQVRDRTCVAPGCRRPARRCEADHTDAYAEGGATTAANVGPLCPRHHALKHHGGWQLRQPCPGHFHWRSPLGQEYSTRGEPIMPRLPDPHPGPPPPQPCPSGSPGARVVEGPTYEAPTGEPLPATRVRQRRRWSWAHPPPEDPEHPAPF
jgi:hypothetical protein